MILDIANDRLREMLVRHEGIRLKPYIDTQGKLSIGIGRNLQDNGISENEAYALLASDIQRVQQDAVSNFAWFKSLNSVRQDVVCSMIFNMGLATFRGFTKTIQYISDGNFEHAAAEMLLSRWHQQVGERAKELAEMMRTGKYL